MEKMNTNAKLEKHYNEYFTPNQKLYSKFLKSRGVIATGDKKQYTDSDYINYIGSDCSITFNEKEKVLNLEYTVYCIINTETKERIYETVNYEQLDKIMGELHRDCLVKGIHIEYSDEIWRTEPDSHMEMIYPYTLLEVSRLIRFNTSSVHIEIDKENMRFIGDTKEEFYETISVSAEQDYTSTTLIGEKYEYNNNITLPKRSLRPR